MDKIHETISSETELKHIFCSKFSIRNTMQVMATVGTSPHATTKYSSSDDSSDDGMDIQTQGQINLFPKMQMPIQPGNEIINQDGNKTPPPPLPPLQMQQIEMGAMHLNLNLDSIKDSENPGERSINPLNKIPSSWKLQNNQNHDHAFWF